MTETSFHSGSVFQVSQLKPLLLSSLQTRGDLISERLRFLSVCDREKGSQYCETLYHYLFSGRSLKETCAALFTHRNNECLTAVKAFQKDNKLTVDGVVGAKTWAALLNDKTSTSIYKIVIDGLSEEQKNKVKKYLDNEKIVAVVVREV